MTAVIAATNENQAYNHFDRKYLKDEFLDVDKRTVKLVGSSHPVALTELDEPGCAASFVHYGTINN